MSTNTHTFENSQTYMSTNTHTFENSFKQICGSYLFLRISKSYIFDDDSDALVHDINL